MQGNLYERWFHSIFFSGYFEKSIFYCEKIENFIFNMKNVNIWNLNILYI